jgi:hypothetical protein
MKRASSGEVREGDVGLILRASLLSRKQEIFRAPGI